MAGNGATSSDQIQVWDGEKFDVYFYRAKKTTNPKFTAGPAWVNANSAGVVTTDVVPAGKGFWYARPDDKTAGTLEQASPIAKENDLQGWRRRVARLSKTKKENRK